MHPEELYSPIPKDRQRHEGDSNNRLGRQRGGEAMYQMTLTGRKLLFTLSAKNMPVWTVTSILLPHTWSSGTATARTFLALVRHVDGADPLSRYFALPLLVRESFQWMARETRQHLREDETVTREVYNFLRWWLGALCLQVPASSHLAMTLARTMLTIRRLLTPRLTRSMEDNGQTTRQEALCHTVQQLLFHLRAARDEPPRVVRAICEAHAFNTTHPATCYMLNIDKLYMLDHYKCLGVDPCAVAWDVSEWMGALFCYLFMCLGVYDQLYERL